MLLHPQKTYNRKGKSTMKNESSIPLTRLEACTLMAREAVSLLGGGPEALDSGEEFREALALLHSSEDLGDGGADDKRDYASVTEAARAARAYVRGKDGLSCDGALVYDQKQKCVVRLFGSFPEYARPVCAQADQKAQEERDR